MQYEYFINLDERGEFFADVRDDSENTIFEIQGLDIYCLLEDGFMSNSRDIDGLTEYLVFLEVITPSDSITLAN